MINETKERSYGLLLHRKSETEPGKLEFFLIKPNAPGFWNTRHDVWGFPKGRADENEQPFDTAFREFSEEVGMEAPKDIEYAILEPFRTSRGKVITIFAGNAEDRDIRWCGSNVAEAEYPPNSGQVIRYAETITGGWFSETFVLNRLEGGYRKMVNQVIRMERIKKMKGLSHAAH